MICQFDSPFFGSICTLLDVQIYYYISQMKCVLLLWFISPKYLCYWEKFGFQHNATTVPLNSETHYFHTITVFQCIMKYAVKEIESFSAAKQEPFRDFVKELLSNAKSMSQLTLQPMTDESYKGLKRGVDHIATTNNCWSVRRIDPDTHLKSWQVSWITSIVFRGTFWEEQTKALTS